MQIKKYISYILLGIASLLFLYFGICAYRNLHKAITQNYLSSDGIRYDFMGFYIQGALYVLGLILAGLVIIVFVLIQRRKRTNT